MYLRKDAIALINNDAMDENGLTNDTIFHTYL